MKKVLVVEDDRQSRFMLSEMLADLGYERIEATDGEAAVTTLVEHAGEIALVLMDIHMPGKSGVDATGQIRAHSSNPPRDLPIVAVSADRDWQDPDRVKQHGFTTAISKPIRMSLLRQTLDDLLRA